MNEVQKELEVDFDLYWAEFGNTYPLVVDIEGVKAVAQNAFIGGALARQAIAERELGL